MHIALHCQRRSRPPGTTCLRTALPDAQLKVFEGLGPAPFREQPQAVAEVINDFVRG